MSYHIQKPSAVNKEITVYYRGGNRWSDVYEDRLIFDEDPTSLLNNPEGINGGWTNATVVTE